MTDSIVGNKPSAWAVSPMLTERPDLWASCLVALPFLQPGDLRNYADPMAGAGQVGGANDRGQAGIGFSPNAVQRTWATDDTVGVYTPTQGTNSADNSTNWVAPQLLTDPTSGTKTDQFTAIMLTRWSGTNSFGHAFSLGQNNGSGIAVQQFSTSTTQLQLRVDADSFNQAVIFTCPQDEWVWIVLRYSDVRGSQYADVYRAENGDQFSSASTAQTGPLTNDHADFRLDRGGNFDVAAAFVWQRFWEDETVSAFLADPWAMVRAFRVVVGPTGATGAGAIAAPMATVAGVGASGRAGSGAITGPMAVVAGIGAAGRVGSGAITAPMATVAGVGHAFRRVFAALLRAQEAEAAALDATYVPTATLAAEFDATEVAQLEALNG